MQTDKPVYFKVISHLRGDFIRMRLILVVTYSLQIYQLGAFFLFSGAANPDRCFAVTHIYIFYQRAIHTKSVYQKPLYWDN